VRREMTVRLSDQKVTLVLHYILLGWPQQAIAKKVGTDQSTVSLWFSRFRVRVGEIGLPQAGKEFGVISEVDSLRSLAAELFKNQLSIQDARQGLEIVRAFLGLGVSPDQH
jgi:hypothetical protein